MSRRKMSESVKRELSLRRRARPTYEIACKIKIEPKPCFSNVTIKAPVKNKPHICKRNDWWRVSAMPKPYHLYALNWGRAHDLACKLNSNSRLALIERMTDDETECAG